MNKPTVLSSSLLLNDALPFGILDALNSNAVPTIADVKLSRYLWKFAKDAQKEQKLIKWVTLTISLHKSIDSETKVLLWKALADFLSSRELQLHLKSSKKEIEIKSIFTDYFLKELSTSLNESNAICMIDICKSLSFQQKILSEFSLRFQARTKLVACWLQIFHRFLTMHAESNIQPHIYEFLKLLLQKLLQTLQDISIKNSSIYVAKFFMIPAMQVCECLMNQNEDKIGINPVLSIIGNIFAEAFFSGKIKSYACDDGSSVVGGDDAFEGMTGKQLHNSSFCFFLQLHSFVLTSQENLKYLVTAFRLFLNTPKQMNRKNTALFFLNLRSIINSNENFSFLNVCMKLFKASVEAKVDPQVTEEVQLSVPYQFQNLSTESEIQKELHDFYNAFIKMMVGKTLTDEMLELLGHLAGIDYPAIETNLSSIMQKLLHRAKEKLDDIQSSSKFFQPLIQNAFAVKKPQNLLDSLITHIVEEIARNRTEKSNQHCVVICGIIGRVLSSNCSTSLLQSLVLDIWTNIQTKARELIPSTDKAKMNVGQTDIIENGPGRKRKLSEANHDAKRIKLDISHLNILHCLLILLSNVLENVDFLELKSRVLSNQKMTELLDELRNMIMDLRQCHNATDDLLGQYYRLLVLVGHQELAEKKYSPVKLESDDFIDIEELNHWEIDGHGLSFYNQYYCKQWQSFKMLKLSMKLQQLELDEVFLSEDYNRMKNVLKEIILMFLKLEEEETDCPFAFWNKVPELINDRAIFDVAFLSVVQRNLPVLLSMNCDDCFAELGKLFVRFYQSDCTTDIKKLFDKMVKTIVEVAARCWFVDLSSSIYSGSADESFRHPETQLVFPASNGHVSTSSLIRDMLRDPLVAECPAFHKAFLSSLLGKIKDNIKGSKVNKDLKILIKFALSCFQSTSNVQNQDIGSRARSIFSKKILKTDQSLQSAMRRAVHAITSLPYHSFSSNQKFGVLLVFLCCFARCPKDYDIHEKCCTAIVNVTGLKKDMHLLKLLPLSVLFPFFIGRSDRYSVKGQIVIRNLLHKIYTLSPASDIQTVLSDAVHLKDNSTISHTWVLECFCDVIRKDLKIFGCSKYALMHEAEDDLFGDSNKMHLIVKVHSVKRKTSASDREATSLLQYCAVVRPFVEAGRQMLLGDDDGSIDFEQLKFLILASFYIDLCPGETTEHLKDLYESTNLKTILKNTLKNLGTENNPSVFLVKTQLLLLYFEQLLSFKNDENMQANLSFMELGLTWQEVINYNILAYHSESVKENPLVQSLLDRLFFCIHLLLPSVKSFLEFESACLATLNSCNDNWKDIKTSFVYIKLVVTSYCKEIRSFALIKANKDDKRNSLYSAFLNDAFHAIIRLIEHQTSSSPKQIPTLQDALSILKEITSLAHIIPDRNVGKALAVLERIDLQSAYTEHNDYFAPLFSAHCGLLSSILIFYQTAVENVVPLVQSVCRKLLAALVFYGRRSTGQDPKHALECALILERSLHFITTNFKSQFSRCIPYVIADYICDVGKEAIYPSVKKSMDNAMYHLASICSDEDIHVLNMTLPRDVQAIFQNFYEGYSKYFKYKGWV